MLATELFVKEQKGKDNPNRAQICWEMLRN